MSGLTGALCSGMQLDTVLTGRISTLNVVYFNVQEYIPHNMIHIVSSFLTIPSIVVAGAAPEETQNSLHNVRRRNRTWRVDHTFLKTIILLVYYYSSGLPISPILGIKTLQNIYKKVDSAFHQPTSSQVNGGLSTKDHDCNFWI